MSALVTITEDLLFPEGPIAMPDGSIVLVEIARGTLTRVLPDGRKEVIAETGGGPNGAAIGPDGACYVCNNGGFEWEKDQKTGGIRPIGQSNDYVTGRIERIDLNTGKIDRLYDNWNGQKLNGPNEFGLHRLALNESRFLPKWQVRLTRSWSILKRLSLLFAMQNT